MWVACFDWACRRWDVAAPGIEPAGQGHCLSRVCATAALTWGVTPPPALPPGTRRQGDAVIFCRGMPLFMAGSVGQSAFVITATFWSHGRATVSPGQITDHRGWGHQGTFCKARPGLALLHEPIFHIFEDAFVTFPSNRGHLIFCRAVTLKRTGPAGLP